MIVGSIVKSIRPFNMIELMVTIITLCIGFLLEPSAVLLGHDEDGERHRRFGRHVSGHLIRTYKSHCLTACIASRSSHCKFF